MTDPSVTVVIPTKDRWHLLNRFGLRAALLQRGVRAKVIVVDDGSSTPPDESGLLADPAVELLRLDGWKGVAAARNSGMEGSDSEWIALLDDDDMWSPDKLTRVISATAAAHADFGYSGVLNVGSDMRPIELAPPIPAGRLRQTIQEPGGIVHAACSNLVMHRSLVARVGGFDTDLSVAADWDYVYRLAHEGRGCSVPETLVAYRGSNWHLRDEELHREDLSRVEAKHPEANVNWLGFDRWIAGSLRSTGHRWPAAKRYAAAAREHRHRRSLWDAFSSTLSREGINPLRSTGRPTAPRWLSLYV